MKKLTVVARWVAGTIFVVMGINGFIEFIPLADKSPEGAAFLQALGRTGYFWPFEKGCEILFGALLLFNRWVVLAIEGLAPIIVNIILFHLFLDLPGIPLALVVLTCEIILVIGYWKVHFGHYLKTIRLAP